MNTTLDDLSAVIGFSATLRLAAWFGGGKANLYVPQAVDEASTLVKLLGTSCAARLSAAYPGEHIAVPSLAGYEDQVQRRFIGRLFEKGFGSREIAFRMGMGERRVQQICRELEAMGLIPIIVPKKRPEKRGVKMLREKPPEKSQAKTPSKMGGQTA